MNDPGLTLRVAVPVPLPVLFDYLPPPGVPLPAPGQRVLVPFGPRRLVGIVVERSPAATGAETGSAARLRRILRVLDDGQPLVPRELLALLRWCWTYYKHPPGEVMFAALPPGLRRADGRLPPPPRQYRLTRTGRERLAQPPAREAARYRLLTALADGPLDARSLSAAAGGRRVLDAVLERGWVAEGVADETGAEGARAARGRAPQRAAPELTGEQAAALAAIREAGGGFHCHLLDGITGSGKTEIYLRLLQETLAEGRQALVLVPEIGLTPQLLRRLRERLALEPVLSHSGVASGARNEAWAAAGEGRARLLLGTRSALFLPLKRPGLIIMDEFHDPSFKQQDGFRYSARDVAIKRAADLGVPIVLGSATPPLETLHLVEAGRCLHHRLRSRATGAREPSWQLVDLRRQRVDGGISDPAINAMKETLDRGEQVLVFLNRRGYAPVLLCHDCGWHGACERCDANLTWHRDGRVLVCHHCDARRRVPDFCPACGADALQGAGEGTEQLERSLSQRFADIPVHRVDRDRVRRKDGMRQVLEQVRAGQACILVGTQMLAKGHHFPRVTLVVIVDLDQALYSADYRALERMGQTLVQVAGRAGRAEHPGTVILQTHHPDHPRLQRLLAGGYEMFADELLEERRLAELPPFTYQASLRAESGDRDSVRQFLEAAAHCWRGAERRVHGPFPAMMERKAGRLRWYLLIQDRSRPRLQAALDEWLQEVRALPQARRVRWSVDVDPQEF